MDLSAARPYSEMPRAERLKMKVDVARAARDVLSDATAGLPKNDLITRIERNTHYAGPALEFGIQYGVEQQMLRRGDGDIIFGAAVGD